MILCVVCCFVLLCVCLVFLQLLFVCGSFVIDGFECYCLVFCGDFGCDFVVGFVVCFGCVWCEFCVDLCVVVVVLLCCGFIVFVFVVCLYDCFGK